MGKTKHRATCPICGLEFSAQGLPGHMRFKHERDSKAPMLKAKRPIPVKEAMLKAGQLDEFVRRARALGPGGWEALIHELVSQHVGRD